MDDSHDGSLALGIGRGINREDFQKEMETPIKFHVWFPSKEEEKDQKRKIKIGGDSSEEEGEVEDDLGDNRSGKKKLKLIRAQSNLLEKSFMEHRTPTSNQKQMLAKQLNMLPRQVEVWFQNRRARIKLKQIELNCQLLKSCCERLSEENRRLKKELQELKWPRTTWNPPQLRADLPAPKDLTLCSHCQKMGQRDKENPESN